MKSLDAKKFDHLIEILSIIVIILVVLAVIGGFARLVLDYQGYLIPLVAVVVGAIYVAYRVKNTNF